MTWGQQLLKWSRSWDNWDAVAQARNISGWTPVTVGQPCTWTGVWCCQTSCIAAGCCGFHTFVNNYNLSWDRTWPIPLGTYWLTVTGWGLTGKACGLLLTGLGCN